MFTQSKTWFSFSHLCRDLHCSSGRPIPDFRAVDGEAGWPSRGRPLCVQPQRPEAAELSWTRCQTTLGLSRCSVWLRRLGVLQPHPAPEERRPRGPGEDRRPAGHHRGQGDPVHLQRHLPVRTTGQQIAGAQLGPVCSQIVWLEEMLKKLYFSLICCAAAVSPHSATVWRSSVINSV